jgi:predicted lipoprotein with Yx(FWY)xxD motif
MRWHKDLLFAVVVVAAATMAAAALGANHAGSRGAVAVAGSGIGRILVDGRGRTLYLFEKDEHGKSACAGQCAVAWPPLIASGKPRAAAGVKASLLGFVKRADGRLQVTYNHHPLYTFVKDTRKGQTVGENVNAFGADWYAVSPAGAKVEPGPAAMSGNADPASSGGYGYGY